MAKKNKTVKGEKKITQPPAAAKVQPANPELEGKLALAAAGDQVAGDKVDGRGGARAGAGRPPGTTDALSLINKLPDVPNKMIATSLQMPFELWSVATKVKELSLSDADADDLSLPITQLLAFYWPAAYDHIGWVWLCLTGCVTKVMAPRLKLLAEIRKQSKAGTADVSVAGGKPGRADQASTSASPDPNGFPQK